MPLKPSILPDLIRAAAETIDAHAEEVTALDQTLGDGDHVTNLQRGLKALSAKSDELAQMSDWSNAFQKIGMTVMSSVGGASGSLYGTLFIALAKAYRGDRPVAPTSLTLETFAGTFDEAVAAVQKRGKTDVGQKTMVDTLVPVADALTAAAKGGEPSTGAAEKVKQAAVAGMESTRDLLATKGRASYLGERTRGIVDAGARTSQLMICAIADALTGQKT
ncbi:MAG: dihydroxyacetone kinase subunit DhaL [Methylohalobius sp. ZOD2]